MTPEERAAQSAKAMWATDTASKHLGIVIDEVGPGRAVLAMVVQDWHLNGHKICHGGFIFTLADSAFAFACNSYNQTTVAQQNQISFLSPGALGERLVATCEEQAKSGRSGVYDVTVSAPDGRVIALMRGLSRTIKGQNFPETENRLNAKRNDARRGFVVISQWAKSDRAFVSSKERT